VFRELRENRSSYWASTHPQTGLSPARGIREMRALQLSNTAGHSIPPKQPMNVVVAPTANQLVAMLAANPSTRTWNLGTAICAFLIVAWAGARVARAVGAPRSITPQSSAGKFDGTRFILLA